MVSPERDRARHSRLRWIVPLVLLLAYGVFHWTLLRPEIVSVHVEPLARGTVDASVTNSKAGSIRARRRAAVTAEIGGRVIEIAHREGDRVEAGDVLVRLNDATHRNQLLLAEQGVRVAVSHESEACLRRDRAGRELARSRALAEQGIVPEDVLDQLQFAADAARVACQAAAAELARARAQVTAARAELDKTLIVAPFDGVVAEVATEIGEWVTPSPPLLTSPAVVDLIDPSSLYVSAPMDEVDSARIRTGQETRITVDSHPDASFAGHVARIAPYIVTIEAQNRTVEVEVEFDDSAVAENLLPGTSADVEIVLDRREDVPRVPTSALLEGGRVLTLADGELVERPVRVGLRNWEYAELLEGPALGELIVVSLDRVEIQAGARATAAEVAADSQP